MRPTLVFVHHTDFGDRAFAHGSELPADFLPPQAIDRLLDSGRLREYSERRSLYRIFHLFSDCAETESLTPEELNAYTLPP